MGVSERSRGDIFMVNLDPVIDKEQISRRPVIIIQNDVGNKYSPTTIVAPITSQLSTKVYPTEVQLLAGTGSLKSDSSILLNQIKTIDKRRLEEYIGNQSQPLIFLTQCRQVRKRLKRSRNFKSKNNIVVLKPLRSLRLYVRIKIYCNTPP